jgi:hypothetical protein
LRYAMTAFAYTGTLARPCRAPGATLWREKRLLQRQRDHIADIRPSASRQSHRINNRALAPLCKEKNMDLDLTGSLPKTFAPCCGCTSWTPARGGHTPPGTPVRETLRSIILHLRKPNP